MISRNFTANAIKLYPIINALIKKNKVEVTWHVVGFMRENKIPLDLTAYVYLLTVYYGVRDLTSAAGMLIRMAEALEDDTRTYGVLVFGVCKAGKVDVPILVLRRMEEEEVPILYSTHVHVLNALLKLSYYAQAVEFVMTYGGTERGLDIEDFGILANRLIGMSRVDEAKGVHL